MPKEMIYDQFYGRQYPILTAGSDEPDKYTMSDPTWRAIEVRWARGGELTLKSTELPAPTITCDQSAPEREPDEGVLTWFDRDSVNHLIRTLRKARDQAFGSDA